MNKAVKDAIAKAAEYLLKTNPNLATESEAHKKQLLKKEGWLAKHRRLNAAGKTHD